MATIDDLKNSVEATKGYVDAVKEKAEALVKAQDELLAALALLSETPHPSFPSVFDKTQSLKNDPRKNNNLPERSQCYSAGQFASKLCTITPSKSTM